MHKLKFLSLLVVLMLLAWSPAALAAQAIAVDDVYVGEATILNFEGGATASLTDSTITVDVDGAGITRQIHFTVGDFLIADTTTTPGYSYQNSRVCLKWSDGETTKAQVIFIVPSDYSSGGTFFALCDSNAVTTPTQVDFEVLIDSGDGVTGWDSAATNQTPVALATIAGTPEVVTMTVVTDFASLAALQRVTFNFWRDDTATGTDNLEAYQVDFSYTATQ